MAAKQSISCPNPRELLQSHLIFLHSLFWSLTAKCQQPSIRDGSLAQVEHLQHGEVFRQKPQPSVSELRGAREAVVRAGTPQTSTSLQAGHTLQRCSFAEEASKPRSDYWPPSPVRGEKGKQFYPCFADGEQKSEATCAHPTTGHRFIRMVPLKSGLLYERAPTLAVQDGYGSPSQFQTTSHKRRHDASGIN